MTVQLIKYQTFLQVARQCDENAGSLQLMRYDKLAASMVWLGCAGYSHISLGHPYKKSQHDVVFYAVIVVIV